MARTRTVAIPIQPTKRSPLYMQAIGSSSSSRRTSSSSTKTTEILTLPQLRRKHAQALAQQRKLEDAYFVRQRRVLEIDGLEPGAEGDGGVNGGMGKRRQWEAELAGAEKGFRDVGGKLERVEGEVRGLVRRIGRVEREKQRDVTVVGGVKKRGEKRKMVEMADEDNGDSEVEIVQVRTVRSMAIAPQAGWLKKTAVVKME